MSRPVPTFANNHQIVIFGSWIQWKIDAVSKSPQHTSQCTSTNSSQVKETYALKNRCTCHISPPRWCQITKCTCENACWLSSSYMYNKWFLFVNIVLSFCCCSLVFFWQGHDVNATQFISGVESPGQQGHQFVLPVAFTPLKTFSAAGVIDNLSEHN